MSRGPGMWQRGILAALEKYPAVYLMDLLPKPRTRTQVVALNRAARQLERAGKIRTQRWWLPAYEWADTTEGLVKSGCGGFVAVARPGYQIRDRKDVARVRDENPCNT